MSRRVFIRRSPFSQDSIQELIKHLKITSFHLDSPLVLVSLSQFAMSMAFSLTDPVLPIYAESFGISYSLVGLILSSFGFTRIFFEIPGGLIMERFGRKRLLLIGFLISAISEVMAGLAQSYVELMISRMMIGVGSALELTSSLTLIGELSTRANRQRNIAHYQSAGAAAQIIAPTIGGILSQVVSLRLTFIVSALLSVMGAYIVSRIRVENETKTDEARSPVPAFSGLGKMLLDLRVIAVAASAMAMFLLFSSVRGTMIPLYADNVLHLDSTQIGLIFSITSATIFLVLFFLTDPLERVLGRSKLLSVSLLVCSLAVLVLSLPTGFAAFAIASIPLGIGFGLLQPIPFAMIIDLSEPRNRGLMMGTVRTVADIGIILGPNIVGWLLGVGEPAWVFYLIAVIIGGISILTWTAFRRPEKKEVSGSSSA
jgi:DHA1 family multidrug resistance protein-like MFS transporter